MDVEEAFAQLVTPPMFPSMIDYANRALSNRVTSPVSGQSRICVEGQWIASICGLVLEILHQWILIKLPLTSPHILC